MRDGGGKGRGYRPWSVVSGVQNRHSGFKVILYGQGRNQISNSKLDFSNHTKKVSQEFCKAILWEGFEVCTKTLRRVGTP